MDDDAPQPRNSQPALDALRAVGGDELVREMLGTFSQFAEAQAAWMDRQLKSRSFDGVAEGARVMRISAAQVGAMEVVAACEQAEFSANGRDPVAVTAAMDALHDSLAAARPWLDALATGQTSI